MNLVPCGYVLDVTSTDPVPTTIDPMAAVTGVIPTDPTGWVAEIKWDGIRAIAFLKDGALRIQGRRLNDITGLFPEVTSPAVEVDQDLVLDGEIVVFDPTGRPDFQAIQRRLRPGGRTVSRRNDRPATFVVFDLLYAGDRDLRGSSYAERQSTLQGLGLGGDAWRVPGFLSSDFEAALAMTEEQGLEGLMIKRDSSRYASGSRSRNWLKVKNRRRQEFVIGGWLPGRGVRSASLGSLLLGYWSKSGGHLVYAGRAGSGIGAVELGHLKAGLLDLEQDSSCFVDQPRLAGARFVEPVLVAEIEFSQWTTDGLLRHPVFKSLRADKDARDVVREEQVTG